MEITLPDATTTLTGALEWTNPLISMLWPIVMYGIGLAVVGIVIWAIYKGLSSIVHH